MYVLPANRKPYWKIAVHSDLTNNGTSNLVTNTPAYVLSMSTGFVMCYLRQSCPRGTPNLACHCEQGGDPQWYPGRGTVWRQPKRHPGHEHDQRAGDVDLRDVVAVFTLELEHRHHTAEGSWQRREKENYVPHGKKHQIVIDIDATHYVFFSIWIRARL